MTSPARHERAAFVEALQTAGPQQPTLCDGWLAIDLAAHVYVRERRPDAAPGAALPGPFAAWHERVMGSVIRVLGWEGLLARIGAGPPGPLRLPIIDNAINTLELFVHTEDVRRASGLPQRLLDADLRDAIWSRARLQARLGLRRARGLAVTVKPDGGQPLTVGKGGPVTVSGPVSELTLWLFNRTSAAKVEFDGDPQAIERLRSVRLGL